MTRAKEMRDLPLAIDADASGRLTVGSIGTDTTLSGGQPGLQVTGSGFNGYMAAVRRDTSQYSSGLILAKSRSSTADNFTALADNDQIGSVLFIGDDGTDLDTYGATIFAEVNGTPSANNMPTDLVFSVNSGTNTITERMRIRKDGNVGIGTSSPSATLQVQGTTNGLQSVFGLDSSGLKISTFQKTGNDAGVILDAQESSNGTLTFATTGSERMRIDSSGNVGIGTTSIPSANSAYLTVGTQDYAISHNGFSKNSYFNGSSYTAVTNSAGKLIQMGDDIVFYHAPTVAAGAAQTLDEVMSIKSATSEPILNVTGAGYGYTHGAMALKSDTGYDARVRGQGIFLFNEENDTTWYVGTPYLNTSAGSRPFDFNFKSSTTSLSAITAHTDNTKARIHASGVISAPSGIELGSGLDATAANTLDDYEEGTWTPGIDGLTNTPNFYNLTGRYTKIGRQVTIQYFAQTANSPAPTFSSITAEFKVTGLPFTVLSNGYTGSQGSVNAQSFSYHGTYNTQGVVGSGTNGGCYLTCNVVSTQHLQFQITNSGGIRGIVNNRGASLGFIIEATCTYFTT